MQFSKKFAAFSVAVLTVTWAGVMPGAAENIERGSQVIKGTSVNTTVYHERGYAVFENQCGSQRLSQHELQNGATPDNIIPCPRPSAESPRIDVVPNQDTRLWGAIAAGIDDGSRPRVSVGSAIRHASRSSAESAALAQCRSNGVSSCRIVSTFNNGCAYITVSKGSRNVAWGMGPTAQEAYNQCYKRVKGGNCETRTIGGCID